VHMALIALGSAVAIQTASAAPQAGFQLLPVPARIDVTGYGEVKYMPDVATITYTMRGEGPTSDEALRAMTAAAARIDAAVQGIDAAAEPKTSEVKIAAVRSTDCKEKEYGPPQLSTGPCAIAGYVATQSVTLRIPAVKDAGTLVGSVGRAGALNPHRKLRGARFASAATAGNRCRTRRCRGQSLSNRHHEPRAAGADPQRHEWAA
jgi:uncharacterized protein